MDQRYKKALLVSVAVLAVTALIDILAAKSGVFGTYSNYTLGAYTAAWWPLYLKINLVIFAIFPFIYYFFVKKDKSEAVGLFLTSLILFFTGLSDLLYFLFQGKWLPATMPWLDKSLVIGPIAHLFGTTVTPIGLLVSIAIGFVVSCFAAKILWKIN